MDTRSPPSPPRTIATWALGDTQRRLLQHLKRRGPDSVARLARSLDLAPETVRGHLNALAGQDLVERIGTRKQGPGRPEILYGLGRQAEALFPNEEGRLLRELTGYLTREGHEDVLESFFTDRVSRQGRDARERVQGLHGRERLEEVAAILTEEGFLAEVVEGEGETPVLRLCHCPLKEMVAVSKLPCRAEVAWIEELLGVELARRAWMPDGDRTCSYALKPEPASSADPANANGRT